MTEGFTLNFVGMTGFEPATPRPPDVYSNRAELHPEDTPCDTFDDWVFRESSERET